MKSLKPEDLSRRLPAGAVQPGQQWGYRETGRSPLEPVTILSANDDKVQKITFKRANGFTGAGTSLRLVCAVEQIEEFERLDAGLNAVMSTYDEALHDFEYDMASWVFNALIPGTSVGWRIRSAWLQIEDLPALTAATGVTAAQLEATEFAFESGGIWYAGWDTVHTVIAGLASVSNARSVDVARKLIAKNDPANSRYPEVEIGFNRVLREWFDIADPDLVRAEAEVALLRGLLAEALTVADRAVSHLDARDAAPLKGSLSAIRDASAVEEA